MLNHSFEHMAEPEAVLAKLFSIVNVGKYVLIRVRLSASFAWKKYREDWVQLDAPRHLHVPTLKSMKILANNSGFSIDDVIFDSTEFQFWGSEQYKANIPLFDDISYAVDPIKSIFTKDQITNFKTSASQLNRQREGDSAGFILRKMDI